MKTRNFAWLLIIIVLIIIAGVWYTSMHTSAPAQGPVAINTVSYSCDSNKTISAAYYDNSTSTPVVTPGQPPVPTGSVAIALSDGRTMTLQQTVSADGGRYTNTDGSVIFWSKGNGAFIMEGNSQTFTGCIEIANNPNNLSQVYSSGTEGFSIRYPSTYTVNSNYQYQALGPGKTINGVKFTIASSTTAGTNLSNDTYLSVEEIPKATSCTADMFLSKGMMTGTPITISDATTTYSMATSSDAAAGNRYDETVYAIPGTNPCIAVRYFVHYGALGNYPAGTTKQFDLQALTSQFDQIRRTLVVAQ